MDASGGQRPETYKIKGPVVWACVEQDYRAGMSAPACAQKYGVGEKAVYHRASRGKWRARTDGAERRPVASVAAPAAVSGPDPEGAAPGVEAREATALAVGEAVRAMHRGQPAVAMHYAQLAESFSRTAARLSPPAAELAAAVRFTSERRGGGGELGVDTVQITDAHVLLMKRLRDEYGE